MTTDSTVETGMMVPEPKGLGEGTMIREACWAEIHRLHHTEHHSIAEIARRLDLDRKTVRRALHQAQWPPYQRAARADTVLAEHADWVRTRAPQVRYSAQSLFQELRRQRGYRGRDDTVKRFVQPLRAVETLAERATVRVETPPGLQSQIDGGQARGPFRHQPVVVHVFVLTLGFSRRAFVEAGPDERLSSFLEAHEHAFEHFGGHTREPLYDRPRTVCQPGPEGRVIWNATFQAFAASWGFEARLCRPYRAQTKGKVESGVKYWKRTFLPGRTVVDWVDLREQQAQ